MNVNEDKYFYSKTIDKWYSSRNTPTIIRWNKEYLVEMDEEVDHHQYLSFTFDKLKTSLTEKPKSDECRNVRSIIKAVFLDHYNLAVKNISQISIDDGEFYIRKHSTSWFEIVYFSRNEKEKRSIEICFTNSIEDFYLTITCKQGFKGRPIYRKNGLAITKEKFGQFLNCTLQFIHDSDSYTIFLDDYLRKFFQLLEDDGRIEGFVISTDKAFEKVLAQLKLRKDSLEKRLIESDTDSVSERTKLRGELEGIIYAINAITVNAL